MVAFAVVVGCAYFVPALERVDAAAMAGLYSIESARLDRLADLFSHSADLPPLVAALVALAWLAGRWGRRREAAFAGCAALAAVAASQLLKVLLAHPRAQPLVGSVFGPEALPSGHTTSAMSIAVTAVIAAPPELRRLAVAVGGLYAWAVAVSLMALAWHLPSDVFAGMLLATGFGLLALLAVDLAGPGTVFGVGGGEEADRGLDPAVAGAVSGLVIMLGLAAFVVASWGGFQRAGRAIAYADANSSAVAAVVLTGGLALALLAGLAGLIGRGESEEGAGKPA